jgi:hypothetical protein
VRCANLIYGNNQTSMCFSDQFLRELPTKSNIKAAESFTPVHMESDVLFEHPFAIMSGEKSFTLTAAQRENLKNYLTRGGFLVASPGCSDGAWASSFTREIAAIFTDVKLEPIPMDHPIFRTVNKIDVLTTKRTGTNPVLLGLQIDGKIVLVYSPDGLNDTPNAGKGCCCCGGNEIRNAKDVNVNLLAYALTH